MTPSWTNPDVSRLIPQAQLRKCGWICTLAVLSGIGCARPPAIVEDCPDSIRGTTHAMAHGTRHGAMLPPPAADHIEFDQYSNTLTLYQLPGSARWMVQLPGSTTPLPAAARHRLPPGVDPQRTYVFYAMPNGHLSDAVTLRQIEQSQHKAHSSFIR